MQVESIIFDIDGTLWDSREIVARGYNRCLINLGHPELQVTADYLTSLFGKTMTEIADAMLPCYPVPRRYEIMNMCMDSEQELMQSDPCQIAFPGVVETLRSLAETHRLFLVSNAQKGYPELLLEKLDVSDLFEGVLCFGDTGVWKGETIRMLMDRHKIGSAVYVGDTQGDLEASRYAGIPFLFCRYGFGHPTEYDAAIDTFSEIRQFVQNV